MGQLQTPLETEPVSAEMRKGHIYIVMRYTISRLPGTFYRITIYQKIRPCSIQPFVCFGHLSMVTAFAARMAALPSGLFMEELP